MNKTLTQEQRISIVRYRIANGIEVKSHDGVRMNLGK